MMHNTPNKLDERWFEQLRIICRMADEVEWLQNNNHISLEEKEAFLHNEIENPSFECKKNTPSIVVEQKITEMFEDLEKYEKDAIVLDLYRQKLDRQRVRNLLIKASLEQSDKEYYKQSVALYGKPKKKYFEYIAHKVTLLADMRMATEPVIAKRLKKILSKINVSKVDISAEILPPLVTDGESVTSADQAVVIFEATLARLGIDDWSLVVDTASKRRRFSVNPYQKIVHIPSTECLLNRSSKLTTVHLEALAEHEVGVHVRRAHEGAQSKLMLLQIGLDSYLTGEEGLAAYSQQQIEGAEEFYGFDRYLAAALAIGMDGITRDFRTVFAIMSDYYRLRYINASEILVNQAAWDVCVRIFRGTTGQTPGTIFTKDIVYLEGNIEMWHLISDKPDIFESLFIGKYNPLLARHVKSLQTLEILS